MTRTRPLAALTLAVAGALALTACGSGAPDAERPTATGPSAASSAAPDPGAAPTGLVEGEPDPEQLRRVDSGWVVGTTYLYLTAPEGSDTYALTGRNLLEQGTRWVAEDYAIPIPDPDQRIPDVEVAGNADGTAALAYFTEETPATGDTPARTTIRLHAYDTATGTPTGSCVMPDRVISVKGVDLLGTATAFVVLYDTKANDDFLVRIDLDKLAGGDCVSTWSVDPGPVVNIRVTATDALVAVGDMGGTAAYDLGTGKTLWDISRPDYDAYGIVAVQPGHLLMASGRDLEWFIDGKNPTKDSIGIPEDYGDIYDVSGVGGDGAVTVAQVSEDRWELAYWLRGTPTEPVWSTEVAEETSIVKVCGDYLWTQAAGVVSRNVRTGADVADPVAGGGIQLATDACVADQGLANASFLSVDYLPLPPL